MPVFQLEATCEAAELTTDWAKIKRNLAEAELANLTGKEGDPRARLDEAYAHWMQGFERER